MKLLWESDYLMPTVVEHRESSFRVWLVRCQDKQPGQWFASPTRGQVVEPVMSGCFGQKEAEAYVRAFNEEMLRSPSQYWAVAVPVAARYEGDLIPGASLRSVADQVFEFGDEAGMARFG